MGARVCSISFIGLCCLFIIVQSSGIADTKNEEYAEEKKPSVVEIVKDLYFLSKSSPFSLKYWSKVKTLLGQGRDYFTSLNLDFKKVDNAAVNEGFGQKVKETAVKGMDKGRGAIKDDQSEL